jgi:hypothetical protein
MTGKGLKKIDLEDFMTHIGSTKPSQDDEILFLIKANSRRCFGNDGRDMAYNLSV